MTENRAAGVPVSPFGSAIAELRADQMVAVSELISLKMREKTEEFLRIVWYQAAPVIERVHREKLWRAMGFASFGEYHRKYFNQWHPRTIQLWIEVYRELPFLTPEEKVHIPFRRLIRLAQSARAHPDLIDSAGQPTVAMRQTMKKMLSGPPDEYEETAPLMRIYYQTEEKRLSRLTLRVDTATRAMWHEWKRRVARHQGRDFAADAEALAFAIASAIQDLEVLEKEQFKEVIAWVQNELLPRRRD